MKDFEKASTTQLWEAIEHNAQMAQRHLNWVEVLDNIKVLTALIDERVETFQRRMRTEQLLREHRGNSGFSAVVVPSVRSGPPVLKGRRLQGDEGKHV